LTKAQIASTKPSLRQTERKYGFLEPGVVLYNFSSKTILIDVIKTNQLEL